MKNNLKIGDVVCLKSVSPKMTVLNITEIFSKDGSTLDCVKIDTIWFDTSTNGFVITENFDINLLEKI